MPGTLKRGLISLSRSLPVNDTTLVCESRLVITKKGNRDGTTQVAHKANPFEAADRLVLENITRNIAIKTKIKGNIFRFKDNTRNFIKTTV